MNRIKKFAKAIDIYDDDHHHCKKKKNRKVICNIEKEGRIFLKKQESLSVNFVFVLLFLEVLYLLFFSAKNPCPQLWNYFFFLLARVRE